MLDLISIVIQYYIITTEVVKYTFTEDYTFLKIELNFVFYIQRNLFNKIDIIFL